jgi:hypothetical protein
LCLVGIRFHRWTLSQLTNPALTSHIGPPQKPSPLPFALLVRFLGDSGINSRSYLLEDSNCRMLVDLFLVGGAPLLRLVLAVRRVRNTDGKTPPLILPFYLATIRRAMFTPFSPSPWRWRVLYVVNSSHEPARRNLSRSSALLISISTSYYSPSSHKMRFPSPFVLIFLLAPDPDLDLPAASSSLVMKIC